MAVPPQSIKMIHLSHVVDYPVQSQEKDLHVEHCFCPQTKMGGVVYCVSCRGTGVGNQLLESTL